VTPPRICPRCQRKPVSTYSAKYCFDCRPGGPVTAPPCRRCGSPEYYSAGLCGDCHQYGPKRARSCPDCLAWGVAARSRDGLCIGCLGWRDTYPSRGTCRICGHRCIARNLDLVCRLCWRQASLLRQGHRPLDYVAANRYGQQLFLADMFCRHGSLAMRLSHREPATVAGPPRHLPVRYRQLVLFDLARDLTAGAARGFPSPDPHLWAMMEQAIDEHAVRHGWQQTLIEGVRRGVRILLGTQDTPGAPVRASDIHQLPSIGTAARPVRDVLAGLGMVDEDRVPAAETWFRCQIENLPEPMRHELIVWYEVMTHGSTVPPRRHPRSPNTMRSQLTFALPILRNWAEFHESLRGITRDNVLNALPASGVPRSTTLQGLRSIFKVLKGRKLVFCNPTTQIRTPRLVPAAPPAIDPAALDTVYNSADAATAALAALIAFHALSSGQLCALLLSDVRNGRLHLDGRVIPLAQPVRQRLRAYLDFREQLWPTTANPHLFIHYRNATHTGPVTNFWIRKRLAMNPQHVRQDRIMDEAHATRGDARVLCDLFGLSIAGAYRYTATVDHPGVAAYVETTTDHRDR
jgi:hypothetical protein